jgi:hypothetical protein
MSIGEELKNTRDQLTKEKVAVLSDLLRKFVKEDLLAALEKNIKGGGNGVVPVLAPVEIRQLFAGRSSPYVDNSPRSLQNSAYAPVWEELDAWAASENLKLNTGHAFDKEQYDVPWLDRKWGGYLTINLPKTKPEPASEPVRPTPPSLRIEKRGIHPFSWASIAGYVTVTVLFFLFFK